MPDASGLSQRLPFRLLRRLLRTLGALITRVVVWVLVALHRFRRSLRRQSAPASQPPQSRQRLAQMLLRRLPWRRIAVVAGLLGIVALCLCAGCVLSCSGAAAYLLRGE